MWWFGGRFELTESNLGTNFVKKMASPLLVRAQPMKKDIA
jgi:hypothetical protein